jgi:septum site-determining protein MinC
MPLNPRPNEGEAPPSCELKAAGFTLPVIRLLDGNMDAVAREIGIKVEQAPDFFHNTPVVIDLSAFQTVAGEVAFPQLVGLLRGYGMIPFGVRGGSKSQHAAAEAMEMAILGDAFTRSAKVPATSSPPANVSGALAVRGEQSTSTLVTKPVRSGQRIYAEGDLSVVAPVSSGAELIADGNIHIYGPLRGRAMAGNRGNVEARIFCHDLQAELVSVAGHYRVSDDIPANLRGVPVQVYLDQKILRIEKI